MQSRLAIVLMSVAGAGVLFCLGLLFGLGVMSSPPAEKHKQIAITTEPTKVARQETTGSAPHDDGRALTPIYPARPGAPDATPAAQAAQQPAARPQPQATQPPSQQQAQAAAAAPAPAPQVQAAAAPANAKPMTPASVSTPKAATPASLQTRNACDVQACASAYRSFRESDCSYQPYSGPRQLCVSPPSAKEASKEASRSREPDRAADDARSPVVLRYHRDYTADGEDDRVVVPADADRNDWADDPPADADDQ